MGDFNLVLGLKSKLYREQATALLWHLYYVNWLHPFMGDNEFSVGYLEDSHYL